MMVSVMAQRVQDLESRVQDLARGGDKDPPPTTYLMGPNVPCSRFGAARCPPRASAETPE